MLGSNRAMTGPMRSSQFVTLLYAHNYPPTPPPPPPPPPTPIHYVRPAFHPCILPSIDQPHPPTPHSLTHSLTLSLTLHGMDFQPAALLAMQAGLQQQQAEITAQLSVLVHLLHIVTLQMHTNAVRCMSRYATSRGKDPAIPSAICCGNA